VHTFQKTFVHLDANRSLHLEIVNPLDAEARMQQTVCAITIVRQQEESFALHIQPANVYQPPVFWRE
jgi:hypothetical protein